MMESKETVNMSIDTIKFTSEKFDEIMALVNDVANKNNTVGAATEEQFKGNRRY